MCMHWCVNVRSACGRNPGPRSAPPLRGVRPGGAEHHRAVVKEARSSSRLERVQLFQLSVLKVAVQHYRCANRQPASGIGRCAQSADAAVDRTEPATAPATVILRSPGLVCAFPRRPRGDSRVDATGTRRDEKPAQGNPGTYMAGPRIHARRSDPAVGRRRHATQLFTSTRTCCMISTPCARPTAALETLAEWLPSAVDLHHQPTPASVAPLTARPD